MGLRKNKLPAQLLERLEKGEVHTISEWAKVMKQSRPMIVSGLRSLQKQGYMYFPVGGHNNPYIGENEEGKVRDIMDSKTHTKEVMNRNSRNYLLPKLKSAFRVYEKAIQQFPDMLSLIETEASQIVLLTLNKKEELKKLNENN